MGSPQWSPMVLSHHFLSSLPSLFPVSPLSCHCPLHPPTLSSIFLFSGWCHVYIDMAWCPGCRQLTCQYHSNRFRVIFAWHIRHPGYSSYVINSHLAFPCHPAQHPHLLMIYQVALTSHFCLPMFSLPSTADNIRMAFTWPTCYLDMLMP